MPSLGFVMAFLGSAVALLIGFLIFSSVSDAIECPVVNGEKLQQCEKAKETAWMVVAIIPIALFFALFSVFGAIGSDNSVGIFSVIFNRSKSIGKVVGNESKSKMFLILKVLGLTKKTYDR